MGVRSAKGSAKGASQSAGADPAGGPSGGLASGKGARSSKKRTNSAIELVAIIVIAILLAVGIQAFIVKPYRIPSGSMEPTLIKGQRVLVDRIGMDFGKPHVGEVAVFHGKSDFDHARTDGS